MKEESTESGAFYFDGVDEDEEKNYLDSLELYMCDLKNMNEF